MNKKKTLLLLIFLVLIFLNKNVLIYRPLLNFVTTKTITGKIIDKKNFLRRSYLTNVSNFYYEFNINGKEYSNPSYDNNYKIGDFVLIEYSESFPFMNRIKEVE